MTSDVSRAVDFYCAQFGFTPVFAADWYAHLRGRDTPGVNLALVNRDHETIPATARTGAAGLLLNFEVSDVDAQYRRLRAAGLPMLLELRDEPFGQRHFITADPDGVLIDVITPIPPDAVFAALYLDGTPD